MNNNCSRGNIFIIAIACKAKRFAIVFFFLLLFLLLVSVFGWTAESFLKRVLSLVTEKVCDQDLTHSSDTP